MDGRILTTHTGSLPRPPELAQLLAAQARGEPIDAAQLERQVAAAVVEVVRRQAACGIDIVNDGEAGKISYATYVKERLSGISHGATVPLRPPPDAAAFPRFAESRSRFWASITSPVCEGPVAYVGADPLQHDLENFRRALDGVEVAGAFLTAASPGVIARFVENRFYPDHRAYLFALADAMKTEYDAIHAAGFVLQVDCPELTGKRAIHGMPPDTDYLQLHLDALNHALRDIPPAAMRIHLCWGNYEGPHHLDTPFREIVERVFTARPAAISIEAANPRHEHEWAVFRDVPLPPERRVIPGVLDTTTNFIEHPEVVAQRLERFASVVGPDRVIAGTDCGFATFATMMTVDPDIAWAKLGTMVEGARIASSRL